MPSIVDTKDTKIVRGDDPLQRIAHLQLLIEICGVGSQCLPFFAVLLADVSSNHNRFFGRKPDWNAWFPRLDKGS